MTEVNRLLEIIDSIHDLTIMQSSWVCRQIHDLCDEAYSSQGLQETPAKTLMVRIGRRRAVRAALWMIWKSIWHREVRLKFTGIEEGSK